MRWRTLWVTGSVLASVLALVLLPMGPVAPARAATTDWATFTLTGSSRDYRGSMDQRPTGFPRANIVSNSVGGTSVGVQGGTSTYLAAATEVGAAYGSSQGQSYLNLRPSRQNGPPASNTTYTFERPTPTRGWTFVLGDIDADQVTVSATGLGGREVAVADLGFRSVFNYCVPGVCRDDDLPSWDPATGVLKGNVAARDTNGASAWFEPTVALTSLTFVFEQRAGFPVYQTWFAARAHDLTGTVQEPDGPRAGVRMVLSDPFGTVVGTTTTDEAGRYRFPDRATYTDYRVSLIPPDGLTSDDPLSRAVDLSSADQGVGFRLRDIVPSAAGGTVTDADGQPVAGITVRLSDAAGGPDRVRTTDADGGYLFDSVPAGDGWTVTVVPPEGRTVSGPRARAFDVPPGSETPITGLDFVLTDRPSGSVTGLVTQQGGGLLAGDGISVTGPEGVMYRANTDADGHWALAGLPPGDYVATIEAVDGTTVVGPRQRDFSVPDAGGQVDGIDFVLAVPAPPTFSAAGSVRDPQGRPVPEARVTVNDPVSGDHRTVSTGADGRWTVAGLTEATGYTAEVVSPQGYRVDGPSVRTFAVVDRPVTGLDFTLVLRAVPPSPIPSSTRPTTSTPPSTSSGPTDSPEPTGSIEPTGGHTVTPGPAAISTGSGRGLADTGGPWLGWLAGGLGSAVAGLVLVVRARPRGLLRPRRVPTRRP